ncbi:unnamed protein product [Rotaria sp. Silwood1]|nr:unnamed protein product [Rotaria sp. Silwood1]CAF3682580.1 unnamed protein product [Rotaria sp. Silwood1]CAF3703147.1 unnamed protein product [Rotaria sp. Silwood1]CAF4646181.1 unnamed protein product [Rotaria sp. Silwood1]CAF4759850.1 unnamed protein product [Rotaria sp. Silwood1]
MAKLESPTTENLTNQDHHDIDDDDDQLNSSDKIVPTIDEPTTSETTQLSNDSSKAMINSSNTNYDLQNLIRNDVKKYINTTIPQDHSGFIQCHIKREREGITKGFSTTFTLYADGQNENDKVFLLIARRHLTIGRHLEYFIGTNAETAKHLNDENSIAKLRGINISGTEYILYDHQNTPSNEQNKQQSAAILYDEHIFGSIEPRKLIILLADTEKHIRLLKEGETIINEYRAGRATDLIELKNKTPTYDEESKTYRLNFNQNRVRQPSHKNFQLIRLTGDQSEYVVMEFGRIDDNNFALDYRHPLTAIQAFGIALSAFHNRFLA